MSDLLVARSFVVFAVAVSAYSLRPFYLPPWAAAIAGLLCGCAIVLTEIRFRQASPGRLAGAVLGAIAGTLVAFLASRVLAEALPPLNPTTAFVQVTVLAFALYIGAALGAARGNLLLARSPATEPSTAETGALKILDTSVIIDGRIADIAEAGFLDGPVVIPQFVLRELQLVADSADTAKRNRGRRGLDVLQRLQKMPAVDIQITDQDFPAIREVDLKLIELARIRGSKIVTNDFNLNKVAQVRGVEVLNINELANALKPIVLPGEVMRVFILKEGKEQNQGVAYLDDGTMVVVDNARRQLSKTIEISVTSVLQTTAGKMIFGKFDDRVHAVVDPKSPQSPAPAPAEKRDTPAVAQAQAGG